MSCWFVPELVAAAIGGPTSQKGIVAGSRNPEPATYREIIHPFVHFRTRGIVCQ